MSSEMMTTISLGNIHSLTYIPTPKGKKKKKQKNNIFFFFFWSFIFLKLYLETFLIVPAGEGMCYWHLVVEARDPAKGPTRPKTDPHNSA